MQPVAGMLMLDFTQKLASIYVLGFISPMASTADLVFRRWVAGMFGMVFIEVLASLRSFI